jgi:hypothetical protein
MLVDIRCSKGKLQVEEDGTMRVVMPFNKVIWQGHASQVKKISKQTRSMMAVDVTIHMTQGQTLYADIVTNANFAKLEALFPHLQTQIVAGQEWYHDIRAMTHVQEYRDVKKMSKEVEAAAQHGWMPQTSGAQAGQFSLGKALVGGALVGPIGLFAGAIGNKGKVTVMFVRTAEWTAQN